MSIFFIATPDDSVVVILGPLVAPFLRIQEGASHVLFPTATEREFRGIRSRKGFWFLLNHVVKVRHVFVTQSPPSSDLRHGA